MSVWRQCETTFASQCPFSERDLHLKLLISLVFIFTEIKQSKKLMQQLSVLVLFTFILQIYGYLRLFFTFEFRFFLCELKLPDEVL